MKSPSEELAQKIVEKLIHEKILSRQEAMKLLPKFAEGRLGPEDWRVAIENTIRQKTRP